MLSRNPCSIALLRPTYTAPSIRMQQQGGGEEEGNHILSERMDALVETVRDLLQEVAVSLSIQVRTTQYQLHQREGRPHVLSPKRSRMLRENDILVTFDPTVAELAYVYNAIDSHALQRGIIAFTLNGVREDLYRILSAKCVPLLITEDGTTKFEKLGRLFSLLLPLNENAEAEQCQSNNDVIASALRYPDIPSVDSSRRYFMNVEPFGQDQRESQPPFRRYFIDYNQRKDSN